MAVEFFAHMIDHHDEHHEAPHHIDRSDSRTGGYYTCSRCNRLHGFVTRCCGCVDGSAHTGTCLFIMDIALVSLAANLIPVPNNIPLNSAAHDIFYSIDPTDLAFVGAKPGPSWLGVHRPPPQELRHRRKGVLRRTCQNRGGDLCHRRGSWAQSRPASELHRRLQVIEAAVDAER